MNQNNDKISIMKDAPIASALMKLGIPTMVGMLISALYNAIDAYFVGGLGLSQMGAVSVVFPIVQIIIGLGMMFGAGASSYISRSLGKGDNETANKTASTALFSSIHGLHTEALKDLFPVDSMDSREEMMIQDWPGALYKKDDTAFLCWTYSPEVTYVLEYTPSKIDDSEIIQMAKTTKIME